MATKTSKRFIYQDLLAALLLLTRGGKTFSFTFLPLPKAPYIGGIFA